MDRENVVSATEVVKDGIGGINMNGGEGTSMK